MIRLHAVAYEDGYAVCQEGERYFILRPPYVKENKVEVIASAVGQAILRHDFTPSNLEFDNLSALIVHLKERRVQRHRELGLPELTDEAVNSFLRTAPKNAVRRFLERIECDFMKERAWMTSLGVLNTLLQNQEVQRDASLFNDCIRLQEQCIKAQKRCEEYLENNLIDEAKNKIRLTPFTRLTDQSKQEDVLTISQDMRNGVYR